MCDAQPMASWAKRYPVARFGWRATSGGLDCLVLERSASTPMVTRLHANYIRPTYIRIDPLHRVHVGPRELRWHTTDRSEHGCAQRLRQADYTIREFNHFDR